MPGKDRRRARREAVALTAQLRNSMHPYHPVRILDLSTTGVRLETWARHAEGDRALVRLPSLAGIPAEMVWAEDHQFGFRFTAPLHPGVVDMLLARHAAND